MNYSEINETRRQINENIQTFNRFKKDTNAATLICKVESINESKMTVNISIPSTSSLMKDVLIGTNIIGSDMSFKMFPTIKQIGVVLISSQHKPILIATIPDSLTDETLLTGEARIGNDNVFLKLSKDHSLSLKALNSMLSMRDGEVKISTKNELLEGDGFSRSYKENLNNVNMGSSKEIFFNTSKKNYQKDKTAFINNSEIDSSTKTEVINDSITLINKLGSLIEVVENFNNNIELGDSASIEKLKELKNNIVTNYNSDIETESLTVEKGDTEYNLQGNIAFSVKYKKDNIEKGSFYFNKDGTIKIKCKDFIVEKEVQ